MRIVVCINDDSIDNETYITSLRQYFINDQRVKIHIKNKIKDKKKTDTIKRNVEIQSKYGFINDNSKTIAEKIQQFILIKKNKEMSIDTISEKVNKYIIPKGESSDVQKDT
jgi:hypothetical protein